MHYELVIVGGGAGGLELASMMGRKLGRRLGHEKVLLIDGSPMHIWKPTLHEVAAGTLDINQEGLSYPILARRNHFSFLLGRLVGLDTAQRQIQLAEMHDEEGKVIIPARTVSYTRCVLALGSGSNFFGTPGAEQHAAVLERAEDAERFRLHLGAAFARAAYSSRKVLRVAIVGAGATGVELSAELLEAHAEALQIMADSQRFRLDITLVEAGPRVLAALPDRISAQARLALEQRGVNVMTNTPVAEVRADALVTASGEVPADLIVWAAGIKAAAANAGLGLAVNRLNQFEVNDRLQTSDPHIWALGDCAACPWAKPDGSTGTVPARAQAAHQQATYLHHMLAAWQAQRPYAPPPFAYRDYGSLVSLGDNRGVGNLMGSLSGRNFFVEGLIAKWMYMSLHLMHHRAILGVGGTIVLALARLLQQRVSGRLKLH